MTQTTHIEKRTFIETCRSHFGANIIALFEGENYARIPDMALIHPHHFILILEQVTKQELDSIRVILSDFPTFYVHPLSKIDIEQYPQHALWQFAFRPPLVGDSVVALSEFSEEIILASIQHSLIEVGHTSRKYFLGQPDKWNAIWAVRSGRWMLKALDHGVCRLWHYLQTRSYPEKLTELKSPGVLSEDTLYKLCHYLDNWPFIANELIQHQAQLDAFLLFISKVVEEYVQAVVQHSARLLTDKPPLEDPSLVSTEAYPIRDFAYRCKDVFGDNLQLLLLSGSQARGDTDQLSDVDTISVFNILDAHVLYQLRNLLAEFPKFSSYVLSRPGVSAYPPYRHYTFHFGCKHLIGSLKITANVTGPHLLEGMRQTLLTIAQMSREYYVRSSYSMRAAASLRWQVKLLDFGYLRLLSLLKGDNYPESRERIHNLVKGDVLASDLLGVLHNSKEFFENCYSELFSGERRELEKNLLRVNELVQRELNRL